MKGMQYFYTCSLFPVPMDMMMKGKRTVSDKMMTGCGSLFLAPLLPLLVRRQKNSSTPATSIDRIPAILEFCTSLSKNPGRKERRGSKGRKENPGLVVWLIVILVFLTIFLGLVVSWVGWQEVQVRVVIIKIIKEKDSVEGCVQFSCYCRSIFALLKEKVKSCHHQWYLFLNPNPRRLACRLSA